MSRLERVKAWLHAMTEEWCVITVTAFTLLMLVLVFR